MKPQTPWTDAENRLRNCGHEIEIAPNKLAELTNLIATFIPAINEGYLFRRDVVDRFYEIANAYGLNAEHGIDKVQAALADGLDSQAQRLDQQRLKANGNSKRHNESNERSIVAIRANTLKPESIAWAWKNRFAFGKMAMLAGDPGLGKSTVLTEIAALHSKGGDFPCNEGKAIPCEVAILTAEDGLRDTLIPRLIAAEADMNKIHFITGTKADAGGDEAMFNVASDIAVLHNYLADNQDIKILIIDPLTAYLGAGAKAKENTDVRRVLTPLVKLAEEFGLLVLANNHLNKNGGKALYRILDSIAFVALGRIIHLVIEDADNRDLKKFICSKINIGSKPLGLTYIIQKVFIKGEQGEEIETSRISWGTKHIDETADEALGTSDDTPTMAEEAKQFLREALTKGPMAVLDIEAEARAAGMLAPTQQIKNSKPFRKACDELGIVHSREGFGPGAKFYWKLP